METIELSNFVSVVLFNIFGCYEKPDKARVLRDVASDPTDVYVMSSDKQSLVYQHFIWYWNQT